jgi:hypothetical protein
MSESYDINISRFPTSILCTDVMLNNDLLLIIPNVTDEMDLCIFNMKNAHLYRKIFFETIPLTSLKYNTRDRYCSNSTHKARAIEYIKLYEETGEKQPLVDLMINMFNTMYFCIKH